MTLIELLVVITLFAILATLVVAVGHGVMTKTRQAKCAGNLRQIGTAVLGYTQDHQGEFPLTTHGLDASNYEKAWVFTLEEYLASVDEVRICPADPKAAKRLAENGTSYLLNSYLTVSKASAFGKSKGGYTNINTIPSPANTPLAFIIKFTKGAGFTNDHTHSEGWKAWPNVINDIQPDCYRFGKARTDASSGSANYLFVDGHVESIPASVVRDWITQGHNFANPASKPRS